MNRKHFLKALGTVPLLGIPAKSIADGRLYFSGEPCKTQKDAEGPFYKANAPMRALIETKGTPLVIEGKILTGPDCETPVANAIVDVWHCDDAGEYDLQGFRCRAQIKTDRSGKYTFTTIYPPAYGGRPRHIHFKIRATGMKELTTQLYFQGDPNIKNDFARNAEKDRVISLRSADGVKKGIFNIVL
jgi:catechol 1,2-dioxygenase